MARQEVVQVQCDRCKRVELAPKAEGPKTSDFQARLGSQQLVYEDLCPRCKQTLANIWKEIEEWDREIKQRFGPTIQSNEAPPLEVAPNYSPPKPHSGSAKK